ncbi:hypothetical protein Scep_023892 [Stephania cephalantha]|uniref:Flotillin-like n=1 Tax=Stephania cephalantha TaxID=152367 RepID=A0AAP0EYF1_9MAGN
MKQQLSESSAATSCGSLSRFLHAREIWCLRVLVSRSKAWVLPRQSCIVFDLSPVNYTFEVQAMSTEKLPFVLPAVFTIGPKVDDYESLLKYARLLSPHDKLSNHVTV